MNPDEMLLQLVRAFSDRPEDVRVYSSEGQRGSLVLKLEVHPEDYTPLFVETEEVASALRTVLRAAGGKINRRIELNIVRSQGVS